MLDRLSESSEVPDAELCVEALTGHRSRKLDIDAWAIDDADGSLHLFVAIWDGGAKYPQVLLSRRPESRASISFSECLSSPGMAG
jgi:hypothetical protein